KPGGYISGDQHDLVAPNGHFIEVKSSSYWQSWKLWDFKQGHWKAHEEFPTPTNDTKVVFAGLRTRPVDGAKILGGPTFHSHVYIFAFQNERDPLKWDALDLDQWEFYALRRSDLEK